MAVQIRPILKEAFRIGLKGEIAPRNAFHLFYEYDDTHSSRPEQVPDMLIMMAVAAYTRSDEGTDPFWTYLGDELFKLAPRVRDRQNPKEITSNG